MQTQMYQVVTGCLVWNTTQVLPAMQLLITQTNIVLK